MSDNEEKKPWIVATSPLKTNPTGTEYVGHTTAHLPWTEWVSATLATLAAHYADMQMHLRDLRTDIAALREQVRLLQESIATDGADIDALEVHLRKVEEEVSWIEKDGAAK